MVSDDHCSETKWAEHKKLVCREWCTAFQLLQQAAKNEECVVAVLQRLIVQQPVQLCPLCRGVSVFVLNGDAVDGNGGAILEPGFHPVGIHVVAAGKQLVHGEPHFYIKRCLFGCPKPCHRTGVSCKIVVWIKLEDFAQ